MSTRERLLGLAKRASEAIEQNGRLRSALRRASGSRDVLGFEEVDAFVIALKRIPGFDRLDESVADGGMVLMAQRNVLRHDKIRNAMAPPSGLLPRTLGQKIGDQRRRLSELRFQKMLRATDGDDCLQQMRRAIALLDTYIHPLAVLEAWLDLHSEQGRRRFARAYFTDLAVVEASAESDANAASGAA